ncbi:hypothetical protein ASZ90_006955 [hydrocarbon metagenome]|uniref:Uncharacterized protein n=1 Tax=hydrocarbon metagenome TaxID=938273 RepID=A0A0W8FRH8_9ZZZZ
MKIIEVKVFIIIFDLARRNPSGSYLFKGIARQRCLNTQHINTQWMND